MTSIPPNYFTPSVITEQTQSQSGKSRIGSNISQILRDKGLNGHIDSNFNRQKSSYNMRDGDRLSRKKLNNLKSATSSARNSIHGSDYRRTNLSQNPQKEYK